MKLKSSKSVAKRFKITATGKIKRMRAGKSHLLGKKSRSRKKSALQARFGCRKRGVKGDKKVITLLVKD